MTILRCSAKMDKESVEQTMSDGVKAQFPQDHARLIESIYNELKE